MTIEIALQDFEAQLEPLERFIRLFPQGGLINAEAR
jgi:hypothetical protein